MTWLAETNDNIAKGALLVESPATFSNGLFCIWLSMQRAASGVRNAFRTFDEQKLRIDASAMSVADCFKPLASVSTDEGRIAAFYDLAVRLRALELQFYAGIDGGPSRRSDRYKVQFDGEVAYFLHLPPRNRVAKSGDPFVRRAFERSRIIPGKIGGFGVELSTPPDPDGLERARQKEPFKIGAGVFKDISFTFRTTENSHFVVDGLRCDNQMETISSQIASAAAEGCAGVIYPELTVTGESVNSLRRSLAANDISADGLSFVLAGSWHVEDSGVHFNESLILGPTGAVIASHRKLFRYTEKAKSTERIELGEKVTVTVLGDRVISSAICLDFCNIYDNTPFDDLDVDVLLVPSCGGERTMDQHIKKAALLDARTKLQVVVVQQHYDDHAQPNPKDLIGYVFGPGGFSDLTSSKTSEQWRVLTL